MIEGAKYAKSHEYAHVDGEVATVGITDFAQVRGAVQWASYQELCDLGIAVYLSASFLQSELGDVVYVELPEVGSEVAKGKTFGVVESVKVSWLAQPATLSAFSLAVL